MKKHTLTSLAAVLTLTALASTACSSGSQSGSASGGGDALEVYLSMTNGSAVYGVTQELVEEFENETGIEVNLATDATNFEANMKVRMASGNLPDVWSTHGWSVLRYSQFLEPLTNQSWAQYVNSGLDESMRDEDGSLYALPVEYTVTGIVTNFDVLDEAGVDPDSITTWEDFDAAAQKIKDSGKIPITSSAKDEDSGNITNYIAANAFTDNQLDAFTSGTFDTELWQTNVFDLVSAWTDADYFNPDYVSASKDDMARQLAQGEAAFAFTAPTVMTTALQYKEDANIGFIPFPSNTGQYLVGGEGTNAFGVWKDSPRKTEALQFLDFLAEAANTQRLVESIGTYSGLTNVDVDLGAIQPSFDKWVTPEELPTKPFFDRVYLPNGMWSTLISTTDSLVTGQATAAEASDQMETQFLTLYGQQE
jgi:ABC-type sugar transport system, periplasmic component